MTSFIRDHAKVTRWVTALAALAAFGPYLIFGVRTEQVVVYVCAALLLPLNWRRLLDLRGPALGFVAAWAGIIALSLIRLVVPDPSSVPRGSLLAGADNLLLPFAAFLLGCVYASRRALASVAAIVAVGMAINAVVALTQGLSPAVVTVTRFWWTSGAGETVGDRALTLGRYPGLLNQPALAGVAYGIALLCAIHVFRKRPAWLWPVLALCLVGGMLVVSKAFLLIGLPIAAWQILASAETRRARITTASVGAGAAAAVVAAAALSGWSGFDKLVRSIPLVNGGGLRELTGGRYGSGNDEVAAIVEPVLSEHLWLGLGLRGIGQSTDSAWFQILTFGGVFAVALFVAALGSLAWGWWRSRSNVQEARLLGGLVLLVAGVSLGFPALTANRTAVWLGLLFGLLAVLSAGKGQRDPRLGEDLRIGASAVPEANTRATDPVVGATVRIPMIRATSPRRRRRRRR